MPSSLSLLRGDNEPEDQVVEVGGTQVKLAGHVGRARSSNNCRLASTRFITALPFA
jgi:hypothetical protein